MVLRRITVYKFNLEQAPELLHFTDRHVILLTIENTSSIHGKIWKIQAVRLTS